jgi:hypothetical protein
LDTIKSGEPDKLSFITLFDRFQQQKPDGILNRPCIIIPSRRKIS